MDLVSVKTPELVGAVEGLQQPAETHALLLKRIGVGRHYEGSPGHWDNHPIEYLEGMLAEELGDVVIYLSALIIKRPRLWAMNLREDVMRALRELLGEG